MAIKGDVCFKFERGASRDVQRIVIGFLDQTNKTEKR